MVLRKKKAIYKVYDNTGVYLTTWDDVASIPSFSWSINGGMSPMTIRLARTIDDYGENDDVKLFNEVRVIVRDRDNNWDGTMLYHGWIASYAPVKSESDEYIDVVLFSFLSEFQSLVFKDGAGNTTIPYNTFDPSNILKSLIVNYRADSTKMNYSATSIEITGTTVSYTFKYKTYKECIDKVLELAPGYWFWYLDADGIIHFKKADFDTTDHSLFVGQHLKSAAVLKKAEDIYNRVYFSGGDTGGGVFLYKKYERGGSITDFSLREFKIQDERVIDETTAQQISNSFLDEHDHPESTVDVVAVDNNGTDEAIPADEIQGYDLESIKPGDRVAIINPESESSYTLWDRGVWDEDYWDYALTKGLGLPMIVVQINYNFWTANLKLSTRFPEVSKRIEDINRNLNEKKAEDIPAIPTP